MLQRDMIGGLEVAASDERSQMLPFLPHELWLWDEQNRCRKTSIGGLHVYAKGLNIQI